jgi:hypothetical protein
LPVATFYRAGQTVNTQLTPNCNAQTNATFDLNDSTWVTFYYHDSTPLWLALVSDGAPEVTLIQTITAVGITLCEGLQVTLNPMRSVYTVLLKGTIIDSNSTYTYPGLLLGSFSRGDEMKRAVRRIKNGIIGASHEAVAAAIA